MARKAQQAQGVKMAADTLTMRDMVRGKLVSILNAVPTDAQVDAAINAGAWAMTPPAAVTGAATAKPSGKAKAAKVPKFIVERAANREGNKALAAALRAAKVEPNGAAWKAAKAVLAAGGDMAAAVTAGKAAE